MSSILWYLHDHGRGHLERARAVLPHLDAEVVVAAGPGIAAAASDALDVQVVPLPTDVPPEQVATVGPWHHAPAGPTLRARSTALVDVIDHHDCTTAVVDLSVEVTVLARLLGLRTITVRQSGDRTDHAHQIAMESADVVWVPQCKQLEPVDGPVDDRWFFSGPFSRFDGASCPRPATCSDHPRTAMLLVGTGGTTFDLATWRHAAAPDGWRVVIAGLGGPWRNGSVQSVGQTTMIEPHLRAADVVVTSGGWAAVADTVAVGSRLVIVPEARPFDEQHVRATALATADLALCLPRWPRPCELGAVLDAARSLDPQAWHRHHDGSGARRSATMIEGVHRG